MTQPKMSYLYRTLFTHTTVQMMYTKTTPVKISIDPKPCLMKTILTLAVLLSGFCLHAADTIPGPNPLQFTASDYPEIQQKAKAEGKLFFLHFTVAHVEQCKWMDKHTFPDEKLSAYIKDNYLAVEVDIEKPEGAKLQHQFDINQLPTTLIFGTKGELIGGLTGKQTAREMLAVLRSYNTPEHRLLPEKAKGGTVHPVAYRVVDRKISRPRLVPDIPVVSHSANTKVQLVRAQNTSPAVTNPAHRAQYPSIYNRPETVREPKRPEAFYTLQIGVFSGYQNAYREKTNLERYGTQSHLFPVKNANGHTHYRLCAGTFKTKPEAERYQATVTSRYPDSFVKKIEK